jgi:hypothetical protein
MSRISGDARARFEAYKATLATNMRAAAETTDHCARIVKKGHNCAIIIGLSTELDSVHQLMLAALGRAGIRVISGGRGGILCDNGVQIRILPKNTEIHAHILLGSDCKILQVNDGDPRVKKANEVFDL